MSFSPHIEDVEELIALYHLLETDLLMLAIEIIIQSEVERGDVLLGISLDDFIHYVLEGILVDLGDEFELPWGR